MDAIAGAVAQLTEVPFYYLRHGETDWNRDRLCQGHTDIPLNETGRSQAESAKGRLQDCEIATICCSPLARARETAEIVNQALGRPLVVVEDLQECDFGVNEGAAPGRWYREWFNGATPAGAEAYEDFLLRALGGVNRALGHPGPVLIVGHGGVYWSLQRHGGFETEGTSLPNAVPVWHQPPTTNEPGWRTQILE